MVPNAKVDRCKTRGSQGRNRGWFAEGRRGQQGLLEERRGGEGRGGNGLEKPPLDDAWFFMAKVTTALLLRPQFTADTFPAVASSTSKTIVFAAAGTRARRSARRAHGGIGLREIWHVVIAHRRRTRRREGVAHGRWTSRAARVVGQGITSARVARGNTGGAGGARRGRLRMEPSVGKGTRLHEATCQ